MAFFIILLVLILQIFFAYRFASCADKKGYDSITYFWVCFLFSIVGYCLVAALPDLETQSALSNIERKLNRIQALQTSSSKETETPPQPADATLVPPEKATVPTACDDDHVACPKCGMIQPANRAVCWYCGEKFVSPPPTTSKTPHEGM